MLQAGNAVDCTLGVTFGLSTLAAAAIGQVVSDASGVVFGSSLERIATKFGLPPTNLTSAQRALPIVARTTFAGSLLGIIAGCMLGLVNLLFIDTSRSSTLKLQAFTEEQEFEYTIEASNAVRDNATSLTVKGPDVDGLLASMTAALAVRGCSIVEIHAQRMESTSEDDPSDKMINDVFYVVNRETGEQYDDEELEELAEALLDSTRAPMNINVVKAQVHELESTNSYLQQRINKLEQLMYEKQITLISSSGEQRHPVATTTA
jgi:Transmembrane protein 65